MTVATAPSAASELTALEEQFPGWHAWKSRPHGLLWATRRGNASYSGGPRRPPEWSMTVGPAQTPGELHALLTEQRKLDAGPEPPPAQPC